jgi:hypothetical protein
MRAGRGGHAACRREWCDYRRHIIAFHLSQAERHRAELGRLIDKGLNHSNPGVAELA